MPYLSIKTTHKPIKQYYAELQEYGSIGVAHEGAVRTAFQNLLQHYSRQADLILVSEKTHYTSENRRIAPDGEVVDAFGLPYGYWEAKDTQDDLYVETDKKFAAGYPSKNIVFQSPTHALLTKWDIFHYNYGLLHHPAYREKYEANLKRDLPHIPFAKNFWGFAKAGARLADLHVNYESQPEYDKLKFIQNPDVPLDWRVEKMKLSKDKTQLVYNDFLTLDSIPEKAFDYRLGTRSALEWIINQYCVKIDKRSGIVNDPNRADDPQYIVKLIGKVISVSLETVDIVENLPALQ